MNRLNLGKKPKDSPDKAPKSPSKEPTEPPKRRKLYSGVGTPEYLAPEILLGIGHSKLFSATLFILKRLSCRLVGSGRNSL
jgi:hypothetical protein